MTASGKRVTIYTDGACLGNPGPGGWAAVLLFDGRRRELSGGYRRTTNNRMEIMAAIAGLEALKQRCAVTILTDSLYLQKSISLGWAQRWRAKEWKKGDAKRPSWDLWAGSWTCVRDTMWNSPGCAATRETWKTSGATCSRSKPPTARACPQTAATSKRRTMSCCESVRFRLAETPLTPPLPPWRP